MSIYVAKGGAVEVVEGAEIMPDGRAKLLTGKRGRPRVLAKGSFYKNQKAAEKALTKMAVASA